MLINYSLIGYFSHMIYWYIIILSAETVLIVHWDSELCKCIANNKYSIFLHYFLKYIAFKFLSFNRSDLNSHTHLCNTKHWSWVNFLLTIDMPSLNSFICDKHWYNLYLTSTSDVTSCEKNYNWSIKTLYFHTFLHKCTLTVCFETLLLQSELLSQVSLQLPISVQIFSLSYPNILQCTFFLN